ncbi:MAG: NAD-dependent epimerase [Pseudomonadota bacterium]|nr:NAD-dependent epimerase [Pseudomonadota bacterium]
MKILVTGAAGFIGMHCTERLLARGDTVVGVDNLNDYYEVSLKENRLKRISEHPQFTHNLVSVEDSEAMAALFAAEKPDRVIHLAAQAGVRYSLENPHAYVDANLAGFMNILEGCRHNGIKHLVYASSSSVYGGNEQMPFSEHHSVDHPVSLYAATKKANELMAHTYSHLFDLPTTGLRFFTVYGPWGRPDMALFKFTAAMLKGEPIDVYNNGQMVRDFTFIDDIVEGVIRVLDKIATPNPDFDPQSPDPQSSRAPFRVFNIGNGNPVPLMDYIGALESALGITAEKNMMSMQPGDVPMTSAETTELADWVGFAPDTDVRDGVQRFVDWYLAYHGRND